MMQNTTHAVMNQRFEPAGSLDDFPTPPWAVRALLEHVIGPGHARPLHALEPACGRGYTAQVLAEYFGRVTATDVADYNGYGPVRDFFDYPDRPCCDWMVTNPPFNLAEAFILKALKVSRVGVAVLSRTNFVESVGRHERLFSRCPPTLVAQSVERIPMVKARLDQRASTTTSYAWFVWKRPLGAETMLRWIPPSRSNLERETDYAPEFLLRRGRRLFGGKAYRPHGTAQGGPWAAISAPLRALPSCDGLHVERQLEAGRIEP